MADTDHPHKTVLFGSDAYSPAEIQDKVEKLGIKNIHVHKGPTIIPLSKDSFDVHDVDYAATDFQGLNWIVEHCGLPRLDGGARGDLLAVLQVDLPRDLSERERELFDELKRLGR